MTITEKHQELVAKLASLLGNFHEENQDLIVTDISIHTQTTATRRKEIVSVSATIEVQPD